jgi:hypothetical protein
MFSLQQNQRRDRTDSTWKWGIGGGRGVGEVAQTMDTHVSKYKNDKIKGEKEKKKNVLVTKHCDGH